MQNSDIISTKCKYIDGNHGTGIYVLPGKADRRKVMITAISAIEITEVNNHPAR